MQTDNRLHALDAVRGFALLLGVVFHGGFSFIPGLPPGLWAATDGSPSTPIGVLLFTAHIFRMSLFFFVAGFFARMLHARGGARGFWSNRLRRILLPLMVGWPIVFPLTAAVWIWGLARTFGAALAIEAAKMPPQSPGAFPWGHLWFLYYLLVLYAIVLTVRAAIVRMDRHGALRCSVDTLVGGLVRSGTAALALAFPVAAVLYLRHDWIAWFGIPTPDQSIIPQATSIVAYGTAVVFGWLIHRQSDLLSSWSRSWPLHLAGAAIATAVCLSIAGMVPLLAPMATRGAKLGFALAYALAIWCWSLAVVGLAVRYLSHGNAAIRYVADASYWIYLVHLPVVVALQNLVSRLSWHWSIKFPLVLVVGLAMLFISYHYLVRATFIGQFLNGRRYPRQSGPRPSTPDDRGSHAASGATPPSAPLASRRLALKG